MNTTYQIRTGTGHRAYRRAAQSRKHRTARHNLPCTPTEHSG